MDQWKVIECDVAREFEIFYNDKGVKEMPQLIFMCQKEIHLSHEKNSGEGRHKMAIDKVREYFRQYNMEDRIREFEVSSATVELAAQALSCAPARIAKTLSFMVGEQPVLIVAAGDVKIDNSKYKKQFGTKAKMLTPDQVEELIGHAVGGVCPFGVKEGVKVYLDESLKRFETVFPACGSSNSAIELTIPEMEQYAGEEGWIDVCKGKEE